MKRSKKSFTDLTLTGSNVAETLMGGRGNDTLDGLGGNDMIKAGRGHDVVFGGLGNDRVHAGSGNDTIDGGSGRDAIFAGRGFDVLNGGDGRDYLFGGGNDDTLEGGAGNDTLNGHHGNDTLLSFSWGGEPVPAQDATAQVNPNEPLSDTDVLIGGKGADRFEFRWLIDAKQAILDKHRDPATGDVDYSMNGVAGENGATHDHWVESMDRKIVRDFDASQGDTLVFEGHTVTFDTATHRDVDRDGSLDTILSFVSNQGGAGAHDGDDVGDVVILDAIINSVAVNAGVFYGVEDPYSALG